MAEVAMEVDTVQDVQKTESNTETEPEIVVDALPYIDHGENWIISLKSIESGFGNCSIIFIPNKFFTAT